jgi:hypothetical protein
MSHSLNSAPAIDDTNYDYWKARMHFFLKSIDIWQILETGWSPPSTATAEWIVV